MRKLYLFLLFILATFAVMAQAPQKMTYQAVVRNSANALIVDQNVSARISIVQGSATGTVVYAELHHVTTNANGLMTVVIGGGNVVSGSFEHINWANSPYFLKSEIDPDGGISYSITSVQQLMSVPYALFAQEAANGFTGDYNDLTNIPNFAPVATSGDYNDLTNRPTFTESQILTISNDTIYLTGGSFVKLPAGFDGNYNSLTNKPNLAPVATSGNYNDLNGKPNLAPVATSGNYNDLTNKPTIPTVPTNVSAFTNDAGYLTSFTESQVLSISNDTIYLTNGGFVKLPESFDGDYNHLINKPNLAPVATSGNYNDLTNKPTIPTVPTNVSAFANDAHYITMDSIPANVSAFTNDAGYITGYTETDPNVPAWAKQANKPAYDYSEIANTPTIPAYQVLSISHDTIFLTNGGFVKLPAGFSGSWNDLTNKPNLFDGNYNSLTNKPNLAPVATSGNYNDLTNKPTIPTVPTNVSAFANDAGYITMDSIPAIPNVPTNVSAFNNDAHYITMDSIPANVSAFTNDAGYITGYTETDPNVPAWAKEANKPAYDYSEIANTPNIPAYQVLTISHDTVFLTNGGFVKLPTAEGFSGSWNDLTDKPTIPTVPTNVSAFNNDAGYLTSFTEQQVLTISHDTIYLTGGSFVKLPTAEGFSGSWNDLTDKPTLFSGDYNDLNNKPTIPTVPTNVSAFNNDAGYLTSFTEQQVLTISHDTIYLTGGSFVKLPTAEGFSGSWNDLTDKPTIPTVPTNVSAFTNDAGYLTSFSEQQVLTISNDTIYLTGGSFVKLPTAEGFSGSYNDLTDKPTIPTVPTNVSAFTNDAGYLTSFTESQILTISNDTIYLTGGSFVKLPTAEGFSGSYNDLTDKPTIPTVPTNVSAFTNDAGYITMDSIPSMPTIPTNVSAFNNDAGYLTSFTESQILTISNDTIYLTGGSFVELPAGFDGDYNHLTNKPTLFSGNYNDLTGKPDLFSGDYNDLTNKPTFTESQILTISNDTIYLTGGSFVKLPTAEGFSGSYNDLTDKPTIPTVPTNVSAFTNDAGYLTSFSESQILTISNDTIYLTGGSFVKLPAGFDGDYNHLTNKPTFFSGNYNDLTGKPDLFSGDYNDLTNKPTFTESQILTISNDTIYLTGGSFVKLPAGFDGNYNNLTNKPNLAPVATSGDYNDLSNTPEYQVLSISNDTVYLTNGGFVKLTWGNVSNKPSFATVAYTNDYNDLTNKPTLSSVASSGDYNDLSNVPPIPVQVQADWNDTVVTNPSYIHNKPTIPTVPTQLSQLNNDMNFVTPTEIPVQEQADWEETDPTAKSYIQGKPDLSRYLTTANLNNYVTKTEDESIGGDKNFTDNVTVAPTGSMEVPSVLNNVGANGTLNLSNSTGSGNCEQSVNFCDLQTVYNDILAKFNALNDQISDLLDSINGLNKQINTPKDGEACPTTPTVSDYSGKTYNTVKIGNQCWMKESLRSTSYADGTSITSFTSTFKSDSTYARYFPNNNSYIGNQYGYLYNWFAVMRGGKTPTSSNSNPSHVQGICPNGWHVPSLAEWEELKTYVTTKYDNDDYIFAANNNLWNDTPDETWNKLGFSAIPLGEIINDEGSIDITEYGDYAGFWSSTISNGNRPYCPYISNSLTTDYAGFSFFVGQQVRCIRNEDASTSSEVPAVNTPTVVTLDSISGITQTSAFILGGKITDDGGLPITAYGIVIGTSANVTYETALNGKEWSGRPNLPYTMIGSTITGLSTNTQYYYRAYATNAVGSGYGEAVAFHTVKDGQPCPGIATVTDIDGNTYNTVMIGSQCWLKENLKVTKAADNTPVEYSTPNANASYTGKSYKWAAAMYNASPSALGVYNERGICPVGWHIPNDAEWNELITYAGANSAKKLSSTSGWNSSSTANTPGNNQSTNNATGLNFLAYPNFSQNYVYLVSSNDISRFCISYNAENASVGSGVSTTGYGVRCLKDANTTAESPTLPKVEIVSVNASTNPAYQKTITARVTDNGGSSITYRRIIYSKNPHPSTSNMTSYGSFTDNTASNFIITSNLEANTTYYFRAAACNSVGWSYSEEYSFTTPAGGGGGLKCPGTPTVSDKNGNSYPTVQIGTQCWMAQNLRSTTYPGGGSITNYLPNGASLNSNYGRLYTYTDAMNGSVKVGTQDVQGVCPSGWHLPSFNEYGTLFNYLRGESAYQCGGSSTKISKALSSKAGWQSSTDVCSPGQEMSSNNASGFNAYPAGRSFSSTYYDYGTAAVFLTSDKGNPNALEISYDDPMTDALNISLSNALSVRCVKGATPPSVMTDFGASNIGLNKATAGGSLLTDGINATFKADSVLEMGICYCNADVSTEPTYSNSRKTATVAAGSFSVTLTSLSQNATYYYRAFARNAYGIQYGAVRSFSTLKGARVNTQTPTNIDTTHCTFSGYVYKNGADSVTSYGFYLYKVNANGSLTTVANIDRENIGTSTRNGILATLISKPSSTSNGYFKFNLYNLEPGVTYRIKAEIYYMSNGGGAWTTTSQNADTAITKDFTTLAKPSVTTTSVTYAGSGNSYTWKGNVTSIGNPTNSSSFEKGFVYGDESYPVPTLENNYNSYSVSGAYTGEFTRGTSFSIPNKTWYVRAYAKNDVGISYGEVISFTTPSEPSASFGTEYGSSYYYSEHVTKNKIELRLYSSSSVPLIEQGFLYTSSSSAAASIPTSLPTSTSVSNASSGWVKQAASNTNTGYMTLALNGLTSNTTYYIVAYAKSPFGTTISSSKRVVKTQLNCGQTLTDQDGFTYNTVTIGSQCWMKQNLKAKHFDNTVNFSTSGTGTAITLQEGSSPTLSAVNPYRYNPNNTASNVGSYGYLYNWPAATGYGVSNYTGSNMTTSLGRKQGACPRGWHIPSNAELRTLDDNLNSNFNPQFAGFVTTYYQVPGANVYYWGFESLDAEYIRVLYINANYQTSSTYHYVLDNAATSIKSTGVSVRCLQD